MEMTSTNRIKVLTGSMLLMFAFGCVNAMTGYFVTPVTEELGVSRVLFTLYYTVMWLVSMVCSPQTGIILEKIGIRKLLCAGSIVGFISFLLLAGAHNILMLYAAGAIMGTVQSACTLLATSAMITRIFGQKSGLPMAFASTGGSLCGFVMGIVLPGILSFRGWRIGYLFLGIIWLGLLLFVSILFGKDDHGAVVSAEQTDTESLKDIFCSRNLYLWIVTLFALNLITLIIHHLPAFYIERGLTAEMAGTMMSVMSAAAIGIKFLEGRIYDRKGPVAAAIVVLLPFSVGLMVLWSGRTFSMFLSGTLLMAFGITSITLIQPLLTRDLFGSNSFVRINAICLTGCNLGIAVGSPVWGAVYDVSHSYNAGILIASVLLLAALCIIIMMILRKNREKDVYSL